MRNSYDLEVHSSIDALFKRNRPPKESRSPFAEQYAHLCQPEIFELFETLGYHPINNQQKENKTQWTFRGCGTHIRVYIGSLDACILPGKEPPEKLARLENLVRYVNLHPVRVLPEGNKWGGQLDNYGRIN